MSWLVVHSQRGLCQNQDQKCRISCVFQTSILTTFLCSKEKGSDCFCCLFIQSDIQADRVSIIVPVFKMLLAFTEARPEEAKFCSERTAVSAPTFAAAAVGSVLICIFFFPQIIFPGLCGLRTGKFWFGLYNSIQHVLLQDLDCFFHPHAYTVPFVLKAYFYPGRLAFNYTLVKRVWYSICFCSSFQLMITNRPSKREH